MNSRGFSADHIPIILLKTTSEESTDLYATHLLSESTVDDYNFQPQFIPVLEHKFNHDPILSVVESLGQSPDHPDQLDPTLFPYGGLIFTSQRAVDAFNSALFSLSLYSNQAGVNEVPSTVLRRLQSLKIPLYAVGPATARALKEVQGLLLPFCTIEGGELAGSGNLLAPLILEHYNAIHSSTDFGTRSWTFNKEGNKKPLLFLAGEKHRDTIPVTLTSAPAEQRIVVEEAVVYSTTTSLNFPSLLFSKLHATSSASIRWLVIFSPTAGGQLLSALGWLDEATNRIYGSQHDCWKDRTTFITSIGPTTKEYMRKEFGFEVDVCATKPSPEGVSKGIKQFMQKKGLPGGTSQSIRAQDG
ncbi:MAG: hypothetical protein LQ342_002111 [Letrouitia transgressa]|nr:MAG: hypothetical protein LQ342_002111 [Letrouitia transgressa]